MSIYMGGKEVGGTRPFLYGIKGAKNDLEKGI